MTRLATIAIAALFTLAIIWAFGAVAAAFPVFAVICALILGFIAGVVYTVFRLWDVP